MREARVGAFGSSRNGKHKCERKKKPNRNEPRNEAMAWVY